MTSTRFCSSSAFFAFHSWSCWSISPNFIARFSDSPGSATLWTSFLSSSICFAQRVLGALAVADFDLISQRADVAADLLERIVERQDLRAPGPG